MYHSANVGSLFIMLCRWLEGPFIALIELCLINKNISRMLTSNVSRHSSLYVIFSNVL